MIALPRRSNQAAARPRVGARACRDQVASSLASQEFAEAEQWAGGLDQRGLTAVTTWDGV